jgi:hypothetical protein
MMEGSILPGTGKEIAAGLTMTTTGTAAEDGITTGDGDAVSVATIGAGNMTVGATTIDGA